MNQGFLYSYFCTINFQVLAGLGQQLASLWSREDGIIEHPQHFAIFLETLLLFAAHPSLTLAHTASGVWSTLLKHEHAQRDPILLSFIPRWVTATAPKLLKVFFFSTISFFFI